MSGWLDFEVAKERRKELLREAEHELLTRKVREGRTELPVDGWRRALALLGVSAAPFFRALRG